MPHNFRNFESARQIPYYTLWLSNCANPLLLVIPEFTVFLGQEVRAIPVSFSLEVLREATVLAQIIE